ncbi:MAG: hypothetical protein R6U32_04325 [Candidatus Woesearchaeota archaeon]
MEPDSLLTVCPELHADDNADDGIDNNSHEADSRVMMEHCMKVLEQMRGKPRGNGGDNTPGKVSMLLGRREDQYLGMPPDALYSVFPALFQDPMKARKFLRLYSTLYNSGIDYHVSTEFDELRTALDHFNYAAIGAMKLYQPSRWFIELPEEERVQKLLSKGAIEKSLPDVIEPMLAECEGKGTRLIVYGPDENRRHMSSYDSLRAAMIENRIFNAIENRYGRHPNLILRRDKSIQSMVEFLKSPP